MTKEAVGYAFHKTVATGFIDMALLMANVSQLKVLTELETGQSRLKIIFSITLVAISILMQIIVGIILIYLGKQEQNVMSQDIVFLTKEPEHQVVTERQKNARPVVTVVAAQSTQTLNGTSSKAPSIESNTASVNREGEPENVRLVPSDIESKNSQTINTRAGSDAHHTNEDDLDKTDGVDQSRGFDFDQVDGLDLDQADDKADFEMTDGISLDNIDGVFVIEGSSHGFRQVVHVNSKANSLQSYHDRTDMGDEELNAGDTKHQRTNMDEFHRKHSNSNTHVVCLVFIIMIINVILSGMGLGLSGVEQAGLSMENGTNS